MRYRTLGDVFYIADTYSATFWARASTPRVIEVAAVNSSGQPFLPVATESLKTTWTRHQVLLTGTFGYARLELRVGGQTGDVWFDDVHFQRGAPHVYRRDFEYGMVLVNVLDQTLEVKLERTMRRILGNQDPAINDGSLGDVITVQSGDAAFLLHPYEALVDAGAGPAGAAGVLAWSAPVPNPSAAGAGVRLVLVVPQASAARIALHDVAGRLVRLLHDGPLAAGRHAFAWDGRDAVGRAVPPGLYFARARAGHDVAVTKLVRRD